MSRTTRILHKVLGAVLTIAALATGQQAWAESTWTVEASYNGSTNKTTFTIKRSDKTYDQKVLYRTVGLTAYEGQHFTAVSGELNFPANEDTRTVEVTEKTPANAYKYQNGGTNRSYKLEVTDRAGFLLGSATRTMTNGTSFSTAKVSQSIVNLVYFDSNGNYASNLSSSKYVDVSYTPPTSQVETSGTLIGYVLIDDSYDYAQKAATVSTATLINTTGADATYLNSIGYKIYATVCFTEKERDDGYQYIQIVEGNNSASYDTGADPSGSVNDLVNSVYKTCFELSDGSNAEGKQYFPHRYDYANKTQESLAGISITEFSQANGHLWQQKFKAGYQGACSLIFKASTGYITTRFDAGGDNDDTWGYKDLFVRMALCDNTAPSMSAVCVNPGRHAKGNTVYVSVAFSEIVTSSSPKLTSNWGNLSYVAGSGTNVLTFSTTIPQDATDALNITGLSGTVTDLSGNSLAGGSVTASSLCTLDDDFAYTLSDFQTDGSGNYLIQTHDDLRGLASYVNGGNNTRGLNFRQVADIAFPHATTWNNASSTENNYTAIGTGGTTIYFNGTYDGGGHTISGIRIYRGGNDDANERQGIFGKVFSGTVRNVNITDTRITGYDMSGGIAGYLYGTVEDCTVADDVCIHAVKDCIQHGGIVGYNDEGHVNRCISRAALTTKSGITCGSSGGIVGSCTSATITDCIAVGAAIPDANGRGAIIGLNEKNTILTRNYYSACTVAGVANATNVGVGTASSTATSDVDGARALYALTLPADVTLTRTASPSATLPGTGNATYTTGADIDGTPYAFSGAQLTLSYSGEAPGEGYAVTVSVNGTRATDNGNGTFSATMPAADATVTVNTGPVIAYIDADGNEQSVVTPTEIVSGTKNYGNSQNDEAWYYVSSDVTFSSIMYFRDKAVNIILCDGATLTIDDMYNNSSPLQATDGSLAIYGQKLGTGSIVCISNISGISAEKDIELNGGSVTATGYGGMGINAGNGTLTIRRGCVTSTGSSTGLRAKNGISILGGTVTATATGNTGIGMYTPYTTPYAGNISILGGIVTATGTGGGIKAGNGNNAITLGCSSAADRITANSYVCSTLTVQDGQTLWDGTEPLSGVIADPSQLNEKELLGVEVLLDDDSAEPAGSKNTDRIAALKSKQANIVLLGRTLYKDGEWNTLCLPFGLHLLNDIRQNESSPLHGATIKVLQEENWFDENEYMTPYYNEGFHRSGQIENGLLYLYFFTIIDSRGSFTDLYEEGCPIIVKWDAGGTDIVNPVFTGVTVSAKTDYMEQTTEEGSEEGTHDGNVTFCSTYSTTPIFTTPATNLYLGGGSTLYYPTESDFAVGAFRAYFRLGNGLTAGDTSSPVKDFRLNLDGNGNQTAIQRLTPDTSTKGETWYSLDGVRLSGKPTAKGIYVNNGRKVIIK